MRTRIRTCFLLSALAIVGGVGGIIFGLHPVLGILLTSAGLLGTIFGIWSSEQQSAENQQQFDTLARLIQTDALPDFPVAVIASKLKRTTSRSGLIKNLLTNLQSQPGDTESLVMLLVCLALDRSFRQWATKSGPIEPFDQVVQLRQLILLALKGPARKHATLFAAIGILRDVQGKHVIAQRWFRRTGRLRPDPYWRLLLSTSYGMSGNHAEAVRQMEMAIQQGAKGWLVDDYLGRSLLHLGKYEQAAFYLEKAYSVRGNSPQLLGDLQDVHYRLGEFATSARYQFVLSALLFLYFPMEAALHFAQASVHLLTAILCKASKALWNVSKRIHWLAEIHVKCLPPDELHSTLGEILAAEGHYEMAKVHLEKALAIRADNVCNLVNLGVCWAHLNEFPKAIGLCDQVLKIDPDNLIAKRNRFLYQTGSVGKPNFVIPQPGFNVGAKRLKR